MVECFILISLRVIYMKKFMVVLTIILVLLILILGGGLAGSIYVAQLDTNYPGLTIGTVPVGGLTKEQTAAALDAAGWADHLTTPLEVTTVGGLSFSVDPAQAGLASTSEQVAELAYAYGRDGNMFENFGTWIKCRFQPTPLPMNAQSADRDYIRSCIAQNRAEIDALLGDAEYIPAYEEEQLILRKGWGQLKLDEDALEAAIVSALQNGETSLSFSQLIGGLLCPDFQAIHTALLQEPRDAAFTDDGRFEVIDEVIGCSFDVDQAQQLWAAAEPAGEVRIPMTVTWPSVTGEKLRNSLFHDLLGACTTSYWNSTSNRISNVELASSKIDGTILYPGDLFSYNTVVGERTLEGGFLPAPAYVDGDVKDEVGGGACQVSSTLYAATLFAFRGNVMDMKFKNNKNYPIKIIGYTEESEDLKTVTFEIWGTLEEDDYMPVEFDNSWGWEYPYDRMIEPADPDRPGYKIKLEHEKYYFVDEQGEGMRTLTYRRVYDMAGTMVSDEMLNPLLPNGGPAMDTYYDHNG